MRTRIAVGLVALLACACGDGTWVEVEEDIGFQGEARRNPLLAAQTLVRELGFEVETSVVLDAPDASVGVVVVDAGELARASAPREAVRAWVEAGGQLVVTVFGSERPSLADEQTLARVPWFAELGVGLASRATDDASADGSGAGDEDVVPADESPVESPVGAVVGELDLASEWGRSERSAAGRFELDGLSARFEDGPALRARRAPTLVAWMGSREEPDLVQHEVGAGRIAFLSSGSVLWNGALASEDNARVLWHLVEPARERRVRFVHGRDESLLAMLFERAPQFAWTAVVLVLAALWRLTGRFGPPVAEPAPQRHDFATHVLASGRFLWRHCGALALVAPRRRRVLRTLARRNALDQRNVPALVAALAEQGVAPAPRLERLLTGPVPRDPAHFVEFLADLHQLERAHD